MQKISINPEILQPLFEAAANAADKGQSQFFTPLAFGRQCATALPARLRPAIVDLNCGAGHLLHASALAGGQTTLLLGADIDPSPRGGPQLTELTKLTQLTPLNRIACDITVLYPLLAELGFRADLHVLNPPYQLQFYRDRLAPLAESELPAVRQAFAGHEAGIPKDTLDSTLAMLLIALDLCSVYGEGLVIANNNTLERLLCYPNSPHAAVLKHCWARLIVPGNPMTGLDHANWGRPGVSASGRSGSDRLPYETGVLYFARDHTTGPREVRYASEAEFLAADLKPLRLYRQGAELRSHLARPDTRDLWLAAKDQVAERNGRKPKVPWNLWLNPAGQICTDLSLFEKHSRKVKKQAVAQLFALNGQSPMELVLQRASRDNLLDVAERAGWRVQPELLAAVHQCIREYHAQRAPLYPLPEMQRLGYLDEESTVECKLDLAVPDGPVIFHVGRRYSLRTQTVPVERKVSRPNSFTGETEELVYTGQELAFFVDDNPTLGELGSEYCFMDAKLRDDEKTTVQSARRGKMNKNINKHAIDFSLQDLCAHFIIPDVPDVATTQPAAYDQHLTQLAELEQLTA